MQTKKLASIAVVFLIAGGIAVAEDSPAAKKSDDSGARFESVNRRICKAYWTAKVAADRQALADMNAAKRMAKPEEVDAIAKDIDDIQKMLKSDEADLANGTVFHTGGDPWQSKEYARAEEAHQIAVGGNNPPIAKGNAPLAGIAQDAAETTAFDAIEVHQTTESDAISKLTHAGWSESNDKYEMDLQAKSGEKIHSSTVTFLTDTRRIVLMSKNGIVWTKSICNRP